MSAVLLFLARQVKTVQEHSISWCLGEGAVISASRWEVGLWSGSIQMGKEQLNGGSGRVCRCRCEFACKTHQMA